MTTLLPNSFVNLILNQGDTILRHTIEKPCCPLKFTLGQAGKKLEIARDLEIFPRDPKILLGSANLSVRSKNPSARVGTGFSGSGFFSQPDLNIVFGNDPGTNLYFLSGRNEKWQS